MWRKYYSDENGNCRVLTFRSHSVEREKDQCVGKDINLQHVHQSSRLPHQHCSNVGAHHDKTAQTSTTGQETRINHKHYELSDGRLISFEICSRAKKEDGERKGDAGTRDCTSSEEAAREANYEGEISDGVQPDTSGISSSVEFLHEN